LRRRPPSTPPGASRSGARDGCRAPRATRYEPPSDRCLGAGDEAELRDLVELADVSGQLEEREQSGSFARAEAIAELLEVARQEAGRIAVALARVVRQLLGLGAGGADRLDQRGLQLQQAGRERLGARPDGEDHRQACALEPEAAEVVVRRRVLE